VAIHLLVMNSNRRGGPGSRRRGSGSRRGGPGSRSEVLASGNITWTEMTVINKCGGGGYMFSIV
jgi:hypothetical protein